MDPSAMASKLVRGSEVIPATPDRFVFQRSLLGTLFAFLQSPATPTGNVNMHNILVYEAQVSSGSSTPRFAEARIKKIEVWGAGAAEAGAATPLTVAVVSGSGDGAVFRDFPIPGATRAHVAIIPNFEYRDTWVQAVDTTTLFTI